MRATPTLARALATGAIALASACAGAGGRGDPQDDAARDGPAPIRFVLEAPPDVGAPIYVQLNGADDQPGWLQASRGPERVYFRPRCEVEDCAHPGVVCGAAPAMVRDISGASVAIEWDGTTSSVEADTGCELRGPAHPGRYVARFCWARAAVLDGGGDAAAGVPGRIAAPTCVERGFTLSDREVRVTVGR